ncbi:MAG: sensor histidine kinase [Rhodoferax sp.]|nr:sensor histidine kinase [Rhodoferax sp.]
MMRAPFLLLLQLLLALLFASNAVAADMPQPIALQGDSIALTGKMYWLQDPSNALTIEDIVAAKSTQFAPLPGELKAGFTRHPIWLRIDILQPSNAVADWMLVFENALLDVVTLYQVSDQGISKPQVTGDDVPRARWPVEVRFPAFHLEIPSGRQTLYIRISGRNSLTSAVSLWRPEPFHSMSRIDAQTYGIYFGMYLILLLFQCVFWLYTKDATDRNYLVYILANLGPVLLTVGLPQHYLEIPGTLSDVALGWTICLGAAVSSPFILTQLGVRTHQPRIAWYVERVAWYSSGVCALLIAMNQYGWGVGSIQLITVALLVFLAIDTLWLSLQGKRPDRLLALAFGIFYLGVGVRFLRNLGLVAPDPLVDNSYQIALLMHLGVVSLGIGTRYRKMTLEKSTAQQEALEATRALNTSLEQRVAERTTALSHEIQRRELLESDLRKSLEMEQQMREEQMIFAAMASHEFRTPLTIIDTTLQQLQNNPNAAPHKTEARFRNAQAAVDRITALMDNYLSLDRLQSVDRSANRRMVNVTQVLQQAAGEWPMQRVKLTMRGLPDRFFCDPDLLLIAIRNLLSNADRHAPGASEIELFAEFLPTTGLCMEVRDRGAGVDPEIVPRLFQKYIRGKDAQHLPGAGLGLYLVERIVQQHGGQIRLEIRPTTGTTFHILLPTPGSPEPPSKPMQNNAKESP